MATVSDNVSAVVRLTGVGSFHGCYDNYTWYCLKCRAAVDGLMVSMHGSFIKYYSIYSVVMVTIPDIVSYVMQPLPG